MAWPWGEQNTSDFVVSCGEGMFALMHMGDNQWVAQYQTGVAI